MTPAAYLLAAFACMAGAAVVWAYIVDASTRRHPRNPRYCHTSRCIRLAGHAGTHVDDAGRSWS